MHLDLVFVFFAQSCDPLFHNHHKSIFVKEESHKRRCTT